ncbi:MAG: hypothetical protein AAFY06_10545 [Pseudomonadota bacterium]
MDPFTLAAILIYGGAALALVCLGFILFVLFTGRRQGAVFYLAFAPFLVFAAAWFQGFVQPHLYDRDIRTYLAQPMLGSPVPAENVASIHIAVAETYQPFRTYYEVCQKVDENAKSCSFKVNELAPTDTFQTIVTGTGPYTLWQRHDDSDTCVDLHGWNGLNDPPQSCREGTLTETFGTDYRLEAEAVRFSIWGDKATVLRLFETESGALVDEYHVLDTGLYLTWEDRQSERRRDGPIARLINRSFPDAE